jgi:hypothetical protein
VDRATPEATQAELQEGTAAAMFFEDADFAKLRSVFVTLSAPPGIPRALGLSDVTLTLVGSNLFTWTGYSGLDPEPVGLEPAYGYYESSNDGYAYPQLPQWSLMVRLTY